MAKYSIFPCFLFPVSFYWNFRLKRCFKNWRRLWIAAEKWTIQK